MADVRVYLFENYDINQLQNVRSKRPATREAIERIRGTVLEDTAQEVDVSKLDGMVF